MNENINLCEILKNCPKGTVIFSCDYGDVTINNVYLNSIEVLLRNESICYYTESGYHDKKYHGDCLLWPSKDCRDWSKWKCPKPQKPRFDPKTFKAFDKILSRNVCDEVWTCDFVSHLSEGKNIYDEVRIYVVGVSNTRRYSIPYNDETKHLVGTTDEAPDFYKYWED